MMNLNKLKKNIKNVVEVDDIGFPTSRQLISISLKDMSCENVASGSYADTYLHYYNVNNFAFIVYKNKDIDEQLDEILEFETIFYKDGLMFSSLDDKLFIICESDYSPDYVYSKNEIDASLDIEEDILKEILEYIND